MKTSALLSLFAAAALVSGCRVYEGGPTRRTLLGPSTPSSSSQGASRSKAAAKPAKARPAQPRGAVASPVRGETPVRPVALADEPYIEDEPVLVDGVGPAGRVRPKPAKPYVASPAPAPTPVRAPAAAAPAPAAPAAPAQSGGAYRVHAVKPGETALAIAVANGMTLDQLKALNPEVMRNPDRLRVGQGVKVVANGAGARAAEPARHVALSPREGGDAKSQPRPVPDRAKPAPSGDGFYVVRDGDTLSGIASREGGTTAEWKAANGLSDANSLRVGQKLARPGSVAAAPRPAPAPSPKPQPRPAPADLEAPPPPPTDVIVTGTDSSISDVLAGGLSGAKDRARAEREEAERKAREAADRAEKERLAEAQRAAEEARRAAEEARRAAEDQAADKGRKAAPAPAPAPTVGAGEYVVQPDDDIFTIALKFDVTPLALRKANGSDLSVLKPGQVLKIPAKD